MFRSLAVMGPSGNGKSTLALLLAQRLGWSFIEGDEHHPPQNIAKMARGEPLTDADRWPFLDSIGRALAASDGAVAACSALKRSYRARLEQLAARPVLFILPQLPESSLRHRLENRAGHFMPSTLLASQLAELEYPAWPEPFLLLDGSAVPERLADQVCAHLSLFAD